MLAIILLGLFLAVLVVFAFIVLTFLDVALADPFVSLTSSQQWQPPLLQGNELRTWAAQMACTATNQWLNQPRGKETAIGLAAEVSRGASYAIAQSQNFVEQSAPNCPSCRQKMIGVTPPEALLIVETIRKTLTKQKICRIREQATQNARVVADFDSNQYEQSDVTCPLWDGKSNCMVFSTRPIQCRSWCSCSEKKSDNGSADSHACTVGTGTEDGLSESLESSGLDGSIYELNSALATALDMPSASEQWARGEAVFEQCKLYG